MTNRGWFYQVVRNTESASVDESALSLPSSEAGDDQPFSDSRFWVAAILGALLSIAVSGFLFGVGNNLFHFIIVSELFDEPQFFNDVFVQSLRNYAAGPWLLLRGSDRWVDPYWLFLALFIFSRLVSFVGYLAIGRMLGLRGLQQQLLFVVLIATTFLLQGYSFAGNGGLFIDYFTHTEIANGFFLLAFYAAVRGGVVTAISLTGVTFFINAFFGVWTGAVVLALLVDGFARGKLSYSKFIVSGITGSLIALLFAMPVISNILQNSEFGKPTDFDYIDYLREYYPLHFLFGSNTFASRFGIALVAFVGLGASYLGWRGHRQLTVALLASSAVYVIGIFVPFVTQSPAILNLHLLRSGTLIHELSALACCSLAVLWWFDRERLRACIAAPFLVVTLSTSTTGRLRYVLIVMLAAFIAATIRWGLSATVRHLPGRLLDRGRTFRIIAALWLVCVVPLASISSYRYDGVVGDWIAEWRIVGEWARNNTNPNSVFLMPFSDLDGVRQPTEQLLGESLNPVFEHVSHRSVWVDLRRGAAVMWSPSYYGMWHSRVSEVLALRTRADKVAFAYEQGISYIVEVGVSGCGDQPAFNTARICIYAAAKER